MISSSRLTGAVFLASSTRRLGVFDLAGEAIEHVGVIGDLG